VVVVGAGSIGSLLLSHIAGSKACQGPVIALTSWKEQRDRINSPGLALFRVPRGDEPASFALVKGIQAVSTDEEVVELLGSYFQVRYAC